MKTKRTQRNAPRQIVFGGPIELTLSDDAGDDENAPFKAVLTSDDPIELGWLGKVRMSHQPRAVDLSRGKRNGFPLLFNHAADRPIGRVRNVVVEGGKLRGELHFSQNTELGRSMRADVRDGYIDGVSVGAQIVKSKRDDKGVLDVTRWTAMEFSLAPVQANPAAQIGASAPHTQGEIEMDEEDTIEVGITQERERQAAIRASYAPFMSRGPQVEALLQSSINSGSSRATAAESLVELLAELDTGALAGGDPLQAEGGSVMSAADRAHIPQGGDSVDKLELAGRLALEGRALMLEGDELANYRPEQNPLAGLTLTEMARQFVRLRNPEAANLPPSRMIEAAIKYSRYVTMAGLPSHGTGDFVNLLENVANKGLMRGFSEAAQTWRPWVRVSPLANFNAASRVNLSNFTDLPVVTEGATYTYGDFSDIKETITPTKYGALFSISREAILADDLNAFVRIPTKMGIAANRVPGDLAYAILTTNPTLNQDATAVFDASHNNVSAAAAAPSVTTVSDARVAMAQQTDPSGATLGIQLAYLLVPLEYEDQTMVLQASEYDPNATAGVFVPNSQRNRFQTIADHRLSTASATDWYATANPEIEDTVELGFVEGRETPFLDREEAFNNDSIAWKVRLEVGAAALGFRGLWRNA